MDPDEEMAALAVHSGRAAGTDAERRAARHLERRLRAIGREADLEPLDIWPHAARAHALHALLAIAGSLVAVGTPALGASLVLGAALLTALDVTGVLRLTRLLTGRRASQNVVSREGGDKAGIIVVVARYDGPRRAGGLAWLTRYVRDPWAALVGSMLLLLVVCTLRVAGLEGTGLSAVQFVPTAALVVLAAFLLEAATAEPAAGDANDAGVVTALRLAERLGGRLEHLDLWLLFSGAQQPFALGMWGWLRRGRAERGGRRTFVVGLHDLEAQELRFARRHGALVPLRVDPALLYLCREVVEDGVEASDVVIREPVDAAAATTRRLPAITLTSGGNGASHGTAERAFVLCSELIGRIDAELGPQIRRS